MQSATSNKLVKMDVSEIESVPRYGMKRKLNHKYPERRNQNFLLSFKQLWTLLPLIIRLDIFFMVMLQMHFFFIFRYIFYYIKNKWFGKAVVMDYVHSQNGQQIYGKFLLQKLNILRI